MNDSQRKAMFAKKAKPAAPARKPAMPSAAAQAKQRRALNNVTLANRLGRYKDIASNESFLRRLREREPQGSHYHPTIVRDALYLVGSEEKRDKLRPVIVNHILASRARPKGEGPFTSVEDVERMNEAAGRYWFEKDTKRFFKSTVAGDLYGGRFFVTGEKAGFDDYRRVYTVRRANDDASISTVGELGEYATLAQAKGAAKRIAERGGA